MLVTFVIALGLLAALSIRSIVALRGGSPATAAGWWLTLVYAVLAAVRAVRPALIAPVVEYAPLVLLTAAFVVAGRRDEPQAEPWWWPAGPGKTGAERKR